MITLFYYDGKVKKGKLEDLPKIKQHNVWIDVQDITQFEAEKLQVSLNLHALTIEDFINSKVRVKVEEFDNYLFCVFYGLKNVNASDLRELDFVIADKIVVSNHKKSIESFERLKADPERLGKLLEKGPEFVFHRLLDKEVDNFLPILEKFEASIDLLEEKAIANAAPLVLSEILAKKRSLAKLKRMALAQREKLSFIVKNKYKFIAKRSNPYFRDVYDHAIFISDTLDNQREAIGNCFDVYMSTVSNNMNQVMKVLSIIATIALPMGVISGIYGTNFVNLPGSGALVGFWVMIGSMVLVMVVMLGLFKKLKWF